MEGIKRVRTQSGNVGDNHPLFRLFLFGHDVVQHSAVRARNQCITTLVYGNCCTVFLYRSIYVLLLYRAFEVRDVV